MIAVKIETSCSAIRIARAAVVAAGERQRLLVQSLSLDQALRTRLDQSFADAIDAADFVCTAGRGVDLIANRTRASFVRTNMSKLVDTIANLAHETGLSIALVGADGRQLARAGIALVANTAAATAEKPGGGFAIDPAVNPRELAIAGSFLMSGPIDGSAAERLVQDVADSGARICLIGLEAPLEQHLARRLANIDVPLVVVGIGRTLQQLARSFARHRD